jgi:hypothetical protein
MPQSVTFSQDSFENNVFDVIKVFYCGEHFDTVLLPKTEGVEFMNNFMSNRAARGFEIKYDSAVSDWAVGCHGTITRGLENIAKTIAVPLTFF